MTAAIPDSVARRAVEWMVELQSDPLPDKLLRDWAQWRSSHPDHERAWQRIEAVNGRLRTLGAPHPATAALLTPRGSGQRRQAVKALAVAFFAGGLAWLMEDEVPWREWSADERTATGVRRAMALADGTRVALNTRSAFDVHYSAAERRLRLQAGEILVATARDGGRRPCFVDTAQGSLQALGTRFAVRLYERVTQVSVFEGAVELRPRNGNEPRVLRAGQQAFFGSETIMPSQAADEDSVAWTDGYLIARSLRLCDFLAELARHSDVALGCASAVAGLKVSGSYRLDDVQRVLATVAVTLDLDIETATRFFGRYRTGIHLVPRA